MDNNNASLLDWHFFVIRIEDWTYFLRAKV